MCRSMSDNLSGCELVGFKCANTHQKTFIIIIFDNGLSMNSGVGIWPEPPNGWYETILTESSSIESSNQPDPSLRYSSTSDIRKAMLFSKQKEISWSLWKFCSGVLKLSCRLFRSTEESSFAKCLEKLIVKLKNTRMAFLLRSSYLIIFSIIHFWLEIISQYLLNDTLPPPPVRLVDDVHHIHHILKNEDRVISKTSLITSWSSTVSD